MTEQLEKNGRWILAVLAFGALIFKALLLWQRSVYIDPDEGYYLLLARNIIAGEGYTMNGLPNIVFPPLLSLAIVAVNLVLGNLQRSLGLITSLSGVFLGLVAFRLAREWLSVRYAIGAAALVLFIYQLNSFVPTSMPYVYTLYRGSDILNCLWIFSSIFLAIRLIQTQKTTYAVGAGAVAACAYLTRPEGFLLWGIIGVLLIALKLTKRAVLTFKPIGAYALVFVLVAGPYVIYLKNITGQWGLTGKYGLSQDYRTSLIKVIRGGDWEDFKQVHYDFDPDLMEMRDYYFGYYPGGPQVKSGIDKAFANMPSNLALMPVIFKILFPLPLALFFIVGLVESIIRAARKEHAADILLLSGFLYSVSLAVVSYPMPRHHLFLLPLFCLYVLLGIRSTLAFLKKKLSLRLAYFIILSMVFLTFAKDYISSVNRNFLTTAGSKALSVADRDVAEYLKKKGSRVIMTFYPAISIRSSADWQVLPKTDLKTIFQFGVKKNVDHIVLFGNEKFVYRIIDVKQSVLGEMGPGSLAFQTMDSQPRFEVVRLFENGSDRRRR